MKHDHGGMIGEDFRIDVVAQGAPTGGGFDFGDDEVPAAPTKVHLIKKPVVHEYGAHHSFRNVSDYLVDGQGNGFPDAFDGIGCRELVYSNVHRVQGALDEGGQKPFFISEVVVEGTDADAGLVGEATHRQLLDSVLVDEISGGVEHVRAGSL